MKLVLATDNRCSVAPLVEAAAAVPFLVGITLQDSAGLYWLPHPFHRGTAMHLPTSRTLFLLGFLACIAMMGTALAYFQYYLQLEPCPMCIMQRVVVISIAAVLLVATLHNPGGWGVRVYGTLVMLIAAVGAAIAGRHVWLQNLPPDQVPECGPGLDYLLEVFPLSEALEMILRGSGECAEVLWRFLGLSIPGWTLVAFSGFILYGLFIAVRGPGRGIH